MSLDFDDYDSILSSLNNNEPTLQQRPQQSQQQQQQLKQSYQNENKDINFNNSLFVGFNPVTSINLNQLDMGAANNYTEEKLSNSTYDSLTPSYSESSPEAILFGDGYKPNGMIKQEQSYGFNQQPFDLDMDVDELLSNDFNFDSTNPSSVSNQFELPGLMNSSNSSPDSFHSSPQSVAAYQPQENSADAPKVKGKRGRKPLIKSESTTSPPTLTKTLSSNSGITKPGKKVKSSHNLIEKKYRTNINSKIIELRNCVPALRILISKNHNLHNGGQPSSNNEMETGEFEDDYEGEGYTDDEQKLDGLKPAKKLNKATILMKATEYIRHLEHKVESLNKENEKLRELAVNNSGSQITFQQQHNSPLSMSSSPSQDQNQNRSSSLTNNLIMGGLTCLVGASTLDDFDSNNGTFRRSLFSIPIFSFGSNQSSAVMFKPLFGLMKLVFVFGVLTYMIEPLLRKPRDTKKKNESYDWTHVLKFIQYLTSPKLFVEEVLTTNETEAYQPLMISTADVKFGTLISNYLRLIPKANTTSLLLLKAIYLRFIADSFPLLIKVLIVESSQKYWTKAQSSIEANSNKENIKELLLNYKHVLEDDQVFSKYHDILERKDKHYLSFSTPFEILSKLIVESQFNESLNSLIELETLKKQEEFDEESVKTLESKVNALLGKSISLTNSLSSKNIELLFLKSLIDPSVASINEALSLVKLTNDEVNSNSLICALIKLQVLRNDLDKSKFLLLFKKLDLSDIDLLSFASLYSIINLFPKDLLQEDDIEDSSSASGSDSSIEYRENHSIEFKLNQFILNILASLRIFVGKKENDFGLTTEFKSILIDDFVNEISELDC